MYGGTAHLPPWMSGRFSIISPEEVEKIKREEFIATATTLESGANATVVVPVSGSSPVCRSLGSSRNL